MEINEILTADDLAKFVEERCEKHWANTRQALLLTTLGTEALALTKDKALLKKLGGLKSFIDKNVGSLLVIPHKSAAGKHGVVPAAADVPENTDFLFSSGTNSPAPQKTTQQSYHSGFWKAFKNPSIPGHARVWSADTPHIYFDVPMGQNMPEHSLEIPERFISGIEGPLGPVNAAILRENIRKYIAERDLDEENLIYKPSQKKPETVAQIYGGDQGSNFAQALSKLSKADQARIAIPLDIVMEMFRVR